MIRLLISLMCVAWALPIQAQPNKETYELSERCGKQSASAFAREWPNPTPRTKEGGPQIGSYENHYSVKLNKCFYLEVSVLLEKGKLSKTMRLYDLHEKKQLGGFSILMNYLILCSVT